MRKHRGCVYAETEEIRDSSAQEDRKRDVNDAADTDAGIVRISFVDLSSDYMSRLFAQTAPLYQAQLANGRRGSTV